MGPRHRQRACLAGWTGLKSCLLVLAACLSASPAGGADIGGNEYIALATVAGRFGMEWTEAQDNRSGEMSSKWTRVTFEIDRREIELNGTRLHLGFPIAERWGKLYMSESDVTHLLQPILTPQVFGTPPVPDLIVLDPGHGGSDPGAENATLKLREKSLALDLAKRTRKALEKRGYRVRLTRDIDTFINLSKRPEMANDWQADLFLSLHFNASTKADVMGLETFAFTPPFQPSTARSSLHASDRKTYPGNANDAWNTLLGFYLQREMLVATGGRDRGLKRARFTVLRDLEMPGLLVEAGFLSHPVEGRNSGSGAYRDRIAEAVAEAVDVYKLTARRLSGEAP